MDPPQIDNRTELAAQPRVLMAKDGERVVLLEKTIRVFGLRVWGANGSSLTAPRPTTGVEVRYDHAFGGLDVSDPQKPVEEPRNPVGTGIARDLSVLTHQPAPMIEDPA